MAGKIEHALAVLLIFVALTTRFSNGAMEETEQRQLRSGGPWMRQMLQNPEVRHVLAEYMLYTPAESKRAVIDSLGGDYLIKKRRLFETY